MAENKLYYCNVWHIAHDTHGSTHQIKTHRGWQFVNYNNTKIGISKLPIKPLIRNFDDVCIYYVFKWHNSHPCPAIGYFVKKKQQPTTTLKQFYTQFKSY